MHNFCWQDEGFYLRGTCINPIVAYNQPGCVSYEFFLDWDPEFVNDIDDAFDMVSHLCGCKARSATFPIVFVCYNVATFCNQVAQKC